MRNLGQMNKETIKEALNEWKLDDLLSVGLEDKMIFVFDELFIPLFKELIHIWINLSIDNDSDCDKLLNAVLAVKNAIEETKQYYMDRINEL